MQQKNTQNRKYKSENNIYAVVTKHSGKKEFACDDELPLPMKYNIQPELKLRHNRV